MPLVGATPLRIDSETLRKTSVLGFLEGLIQGLCIFWLAVRPPRCSLDEIPRLRLRNGAAAALRCCPV